jgi:hypothetical protein
MKEIFGVDMIVWGLSEVQIPRLAALARDDTGTVIPSEVEGSALPALARDDET